MRVHAYICSYLYLFNINRPYRRYLKSNFEPLVSMKLVERGTRTLAATHLRV